MGGFGPSAPLQIGGADVIDPTEPPLGDELVGKRDGGHPGDS
jgi:hypothetical protein